MMRALRWVLLAVLGLALLTVAMANRTTVTLRALPEVLECHLISGDFDYLVKARLKEMSTYRKLLGNLLKKLPASASSHSYVVMEEVKEGLYLDLDV